MLTTQKQVRASFWEWVKNYRVPGITHKRDRDGNYLTDTRCAFVDYVNSLAREGEISEALAQRVTL